MRILVCGGRDFEDWGLLSAELHDLIYDGDHTDYSKITIISGMARGADMLAVRFAIENNCILRKYPANWASLGKAAGMIRNKQMLKEGKPDIVLAFRGGRGTANMVSLSKKAGVTVKEVY